MRNLLLFAALAMAAALQACAQTPRSYAEQVCANRNVASASPSYATCVEEETQRYLDANPPGGPGY